MWDNHHEPYRSLGAGGEKPPRRSRLPRSQRGFHRPGAGDFAGLRRSTGVGKPGHPGPWLPSLLRVRLHTPLGDQPLAPPCRSTLLASPMRSARGTAPSLLVGRLGCPALPLVAQEPCRRAPVAAAFAGAGSLYTERERAIACFGPLVGSRNRTAKRLSSRLQGAHAVRDRGLAAQPALSLSFTMPLALLISSCPA